MHNKQYVKLSQTVSPQVQELPKSMSLIAERLGFFKSMFSGFKSQ